MQSLCNTSECKQNYYLIYISRIEKTLNILVNANSSKLMGINRVFNEADIWLKNEMLEGDSTDIVDHNLYR